MSTINTNPINVNYPVPGVNNNSQGFRDNFASIVTNLNAAGAEITDLQNKVVVKQALIGTTVNNDMANTLISNASTRSFRATTYNLGNALAGTVLVNVSLGDVQYGTIAGDTTINFGSWAPSGTQSNVQLNLSISNNISTITFPASVTLSPDTGATTLENYSNSSGNLAVTVPNGVSQLNYLISTTDCGNTLYITPINRPRISTSIQQRSPIPTGFQGDVAGDVAVDANYVYVCSGSYDATTVTKTGVVATYSGNLINCTSTTSLVTNAPIIFTGTSFGGIVANTTYYIKSIPDGANITISATGFDGLAGNAVALSAATGNMAANSYNGSNIWKRIDLAGASGNDVVTGNLTVNYAANIGTNLNVVGNITAGNISGNISGSLSNGTSNVSIPAVNSTVNTVVAGTTRIAATTSGANVTGTLGVTSTITGTTLVSNIATGTAPLTVTSTTLVPNLYVARANVSDYDTVTLVNTGTYYPQLVNATSGNLATGANANLSFNAATGNLSTTLLNVTSNANVGNLGFGSGVITGTGNITGGNIIGIIAAGSNNITTTGNVSAANSITSAYAIGSVGTGISAAGTTQATATAITKDNNIVSTVSAGANGVVLPTAVAGMRIYIKNSSASALNVFPAVNAAINALSANVSISQAANASAFYISTSTTQWYSY
jgi:hypothetical protein